MMGESAGNPRVGGHTAKALLPHCSVHAATPGAEDTPPQHGIKSVCPFSESIARHEYSLGYFLHMFLHRPAFNGLDETFSEVPGLLHYCLPGSMSFRGIRSICPEVFSLGDTAARQCCNKFIGRMDKKNIAGQLLRQFSVSQPLIEPYRHQPSVVVKNKRDIIIVRFVPLIQMIIDETPVAVFTVRRPVNIPHTGNGERNGR